MSFSLGDFVMAQFLIVKTSSLGDIIQAFSVLNYLHGRFPDVAVDWVVEKRFASIVSAHPLVRRTIAFDIKGCQDHWRQWTFWKSMIRSFQELRRVRYDAVFDLQGNCKSGALTFLCRAIEKVGFGKKSVREWPNVFATHQRFEIPRSINIRLQYVGLVQQFFNDHSSVTLEGVRFKIKPAEIKQIQTVLELPALQREIRVMVCPGSKWLNKQLPLDTLIAMLSKIERAMHCSFLLVWGADDEREICQSIQRRFSDFSHVVDRLELPLWQNLMNVMDLVIAVDSGALHLAGTTSTPSFSIFGPTSPKIFKPVGPAHFAFQGSCPLRVVFEKQCPFLRSCQTGECIRKLKADVLFTHFWKWWSEVNSEIVSSK